MVDSVTKKYKFLAVPRKKKKKKKTFCGINYSIFFLERKEIMFK